MYKSKEFIIKISASEEDASWALDANELYTRLTDLVGYAGYFWIDSVKRNTPPGKNFTGKIPAIKELRTLINGLSLVEGKDIVDAATSLGKFHTHGGVLIEYSPDSGNYTISDAR